MCSKAWTSLTKANGFSPFEFIVQQKPQQQTHAQGIHWRDHIFHYLEAANLKDE